MLIFPFILFHQHQFKPLFFNSIITYIKNNQNSNANIKAAQIHSASHQKYGKYVHLPQKPQQINHP